MTQSVRLYVLLLIACACPLSWEILLLLLLIRLLFSEFPYQLQKLWLLPWRSGFPHLKSWHRACVFYTHKMIILWHSFSSPFRSYALVFCIFVLYAWGWRPRFWAPCNILNYNILNCTSALQQDPLSWRALQCWDAQVRAALSSSQVLQPSSQKSWDKHVIEASYDSLLRAAADEYTRARLLSVAALHAGDWLKVTAVSSLGLRIDNDGMRIASGLHAPIPRHNALKMAFFLIEGGIKKY